MLGSMEVTPRRVGLLALVLLSLLPTAIIAWHSRAMPQAGLFHDDALYLISAKSLAEGNGYKIESFPGQPAQTKYPPLYSMVLSIAWKLNGHFPQNLSIVALITWLGFALVLAAAWWLGRQQGFADWEATLLCLWIALNPLTAVLSLMPMSDAYFTALLLLAIGLAELAMREGPDCRKYAIAAGLAGAAAFLTRTAALPLLVTVPLCLLWRKRMGAAVSFLCTMMPAVAGWMIWSKLNRVGATDMHTIYYTDYFEHFLRDVKGMDYPAMVWGNISSLGKAVGELVVPDDAYTFPTLTFSRVLSAGVIAGSIRLVKQGRFTHLALFSIPYAIQLVLWDYPPNTRFLFPLFPLIWAALYVEVRHLQLGVAKAWKKGGLDRFAAGVAPLLLLWFLYYAGSQAWSGTVVLSQVMAAQETDLETKLPAYDWLRKNVPLDQPILAARDPIAYLYSGHPALSFRVPRRYIFEGDGPGVERLFETMPELLRQYGVEYIVSSPTDFVLDGDALKAPAMKKVLGNELLFTQVFRNQSVTIYRYKGLH